MDARAGPRRRFGTDADANRLDRRNRHQRLREPAVELAVPLDVAAEADGHAGGDDLEAAAHRVSRRFRRVNRLDHPLRRLFIHAAKRRVVWQRRGLRERHGRAFGKMDAADREDVAGDADAGGCQQLAGDGAGGDPRRGLARARPLEDVAHVVAAVLGDAGQVGMPRPRPRDRRAIARRSRPAPARARCAWCCCQFTQSRFSMSMAIGPPIVWPARTPEMMSARSDSMAIRRPRP